MRRNLRNRLWWVHQHQHASSAGFHRAWRLSAFRCSHQPINNALAATIVVGLIFSTCRDFVTAVLLLSNCYRYLSIIFTIYSRTNSDSESVFFALLAVFPPTQKGENNFFPSHFLLSTFALELCTYIVPYFFCDSCSTISIVSSKSKCNAIIVQYNIQPLRRKSMVQEMLKNLITILLIYGSISSKHFISGRFQ